MRHSSGRPTRPALAIRVDHPPFRVLLEPLWVVADGEPCVDANPRAVGLIDHAVEEPVVLAAWSEESTIERIVCLDEQVGQAKPAGVGGPPGSPARRPSHRHRPTPRNADRDLGRVVHPVAEALSRTHRLVRQRSMNFLITTA